MRDEVDEVNFDHTDPLHWAAITVIGMIACKCGVSSFTECERLSCSIGGGKGISALEVQPWRFAPGELARVAEIIGVDNLESLVLRANEELLRTGRSRAA